MTIDICADAIITGEAAHIVPTYKRPPFVLVHGEGVTLFDEQGNAYTDWVAGIAVNALGYGDRAIESAIRTQLSTGILHVSNLYHTAPHVELAARLTAASFADRVYFCNSGAEANEAAIKFARKAAQSPDKRTIVTFSGGFHGRTMGALALTPRAKYQTPFEPLMPGVRVATFNDADSARDAIDDSVAAVIVEPVQGEGGVNVATPEFLQTLRDLCDTHDALLIFDEVQCGVGRSGKLWAHQLSGVMPDIMTLAKPLAAGLPVGAVLCTEPVATAMQPGDHGSTFAGGPVVMAAALAVLDRVNTAEFLQQVTEAGAYLRAGLRSLDHPGIVAVRGVGLMNAVVFDRPVTPIIEAGYKHGLLLVNAGPEVLRFVPPLVIERAHVDALIDKLSVILAAL